MNTTDKERYRISRERAFARSALLHYTIYLDLMEREEDPRMKRLLNEIALVSKEEFTFWGTKSAVRGDEVRGGFLVKLYHRALRKTLGVTLMTQFMINRERHKLRRFGAYCVDCLDHADQKAINVLIARSLALVPITEDPFFKFFARIVLSFNIALIGLVGVLVGLQIVLRDVHMVVAAFLVMGVMGAASVAASAYLIQTCSEDRDTHDSAFFVGMSCLLISLVLSMPFLVSGSLMVGNIAVLVIVAMLLLTNALYSAVVRGTSYCSHVGSILALACTVVFVAFCSATLIRHLLIP